MAKDPKTTESAEAAETTDDQQVAPDHHQTLLEGQGEPQPEDVQEGADGVDSPVDAEQDAQPDTAQGVSEEAQPTTSTEPAFLDTLRQLGWEGDDEQQAQQMLLDAYQRTTSDYERAQERLAEQEELANYGLQYLKAERERQEAEQQQQAAQQPQADEHWWKPPEFDFATLEKYRDVTFAEDGTPQIGWKKSTPRDIVANAEAYQEYVDKWATDLVQRPHEVLPKIIEHEFDRMFEERIAERERAAQLDSFAESVKQTNQDWMYTTDSQGREVLTDQGRQMTQVLQEVASAGVTDPQQQWELAVARYDYLNRLHSQAEETAAETSKETAAKRRKEHQEKGLSATPNRTGTVPRPEDDNAIAQNPNLTPGQRLVEQLRREGADI